ncbi:hypothetical protein [Jeotgalibacillus proteolyticus]|uniref:Ribosomal protein L7/L12 C-terminal domain-containing protein n=1 Tax=Jeotgalibacillus proteolyticus TaxID=2082395 RepID=A0A2S5GGY3_9BACL|nr:hypothetical protein [Jeotgalibacillus proteolyticus]PPA72297.1 hypothetical protein C4B60_02670 [Jeotgalibacillus proteolyticus]
MDWDISLIIFISLSVVIIGTLLGKKFKGPIYHPIDTEDPHLQAHVREMISNGENDVKIIKSVREKTGASLLDAKKYVDRCK